MIDPNWLVGFSGGEGCFAPQGVNLRKSKTHKTESQVGLCFSLAQHSRDHLLIKSLVKIFGCGIYSESSSQGPMSRFTVIKFKDIEENIIPFFNKYLLQGVKSKDYADFYKVAFFNK